MTITQRSCLPPFLAPTFDYIVMINNYKAMDALKWYIYSYKVVISCTSRCTNNIALIVLCH